MVTVTTKWWLRVIGYAGGLLGLIALMWIPHTWSGVLIFAGILCVWLFAAGMILHYRRSPK